MQCGMERRSKTDAIISELSQDRNGAMATFFKGEGRHGKSKFNSGITELFGESSHSEDLKYQFVNVTLGNFQELFNAVDRLLDERGIVLSA